MTTMSQTTQSRPKSFIAIYALAAVLVAFASALAIYAHVAPGQVTFLPADFDAQVALFLVPLAVLMFAIIAEVLHATLKGSAPLMSEIPTRSIRQWTPGRGEG
jgi:hypothetical protein